MLSMFCRLYFGWKHTYVLQLHKGVNFHEAYDQKGWGSFSLRTAMASVVFRLGLWNWLCVGWSKMNTAVRLVRGLVKVILTWRMYSAIKLSSISSGCFSTYLTSGISFMPMQSMKYICSGFIFT